MTKAAIVPGTQPQSVKIKTITIDQQPLSKTAKGGKMIDNITRKILMTKKINL
jgi:phosphopantothenate synthetase